MSHSLRRQLALLLGAGAILLVAIVVAGALAVTGLDRAKTQLVDRVQVARVASLDLQVALFDQQASVRGFTLSGAPQLLESYQEATETEADAREELLASVGDDELVVDRLERLDELATNWRETLAEPAIEAAEAGRMNDAVAALTDPAATSFDEVADAGVALGDALRERRNDAVAEADQAISTLVAVAVVALVIVTAGGVILVVALRRFVLVPLERLGSEARNTAGGNFDSPVTEHGPAEIRQVARDVEGMRWQILSELQQTREAQAESTQHAADLERSNRDLEQFAYVASHDLQEPLRKVAGFCQLLERRYGDQLDERASEYVHYAVDGAQRMQILINDLLMFSRVGRTTERFELVDLNAKVRKAWGDVADNEEATLEVDGELPVVAGDPALLRTLFANLMANAVKFRSEHPPVVRISAERTEDTWEIAVQDNGIGIDPQFAERIFNIFQRLHTRDVYDGTGIGLAICKRIVEFHGGSIHLSPSHEGACFVIAFPVLSEDGSIDEPPTPLIPYRPEGTPA